MRERVVYIGGAARSGTTVLGRLLASQDDVVWAGELVWLARDLLEDRRCACGHSASDCPFWSAVRQRLSWDDDALRTHCRATWRGRHLGWLFGSDGAEGVYDAVAHVAGAKTVVDTSKYAARAHWAQRTANARLVWLRQEPDALLARLMRPRDHGRSFGLLLAVLYTVWVDRCWTRLSKKSSVAKIATETLFRDPASVLTGLVEPSRSIQWSTDQPLPPAHALTGHPRAMHDATWDVSPAPSLGFWPSTAARWLSWLRGGLP